MRVADALRRAGACAEQASASARALVLAQAQGLDSHGLSRVAQYRRHLTAGRVDGAALPRTVNARSAAVLIDAGGGLALAACELAVQEAIARARSAGIAIAGVTNSHHAGVLVDHLRPVAEAGMLGLALCNTPAAMPVAGGRHAVLGTNPVAAAFARRDAAPLLIDLSLSEIARGKLMVAAQQGQPIPLGWALAADGQPTTDPQAGLQGSMLALGAATSSKGATLALMVELLAAALLGANFGFEASSFFAADGNRPRLGQVFIVIDPGALAGSDVYLDRVEALIAEMRTDDGVRLPGERREALLAAARRDGLLFDPGWLLQWRDNA